MYLQILKERREKLGEALSFYLEVKSKQETLDKVRKLIYRVDYLIGIELKKKETK